MIDILREIWIPLVLLAILIAITVIFHIQFNAIAFVGGFVDAVVALLLNRK